MDKVVEYILVNKQLDMGIGKTAGQVAHVQTKIDAYIRELTLKQEVCFDIDVDEMDELTDQEWDDLFTYNYWLEQGNQTKVILRAKEKDLQRALDMGAFGVRDSGLTEIAPNSLTAVGFLPQPKSNLVDFTKKFQLL